MNLGFIFREKYKKELKKYGKKEVSLTLREVDKIIFKDEKPKIASYGQGVVSIRGSVFNVEEKYNKIFDDKIFDEEIIDKGKR